MRDLSPEAQLESYEVEIDAAERLCRKVGKAYLGSYNTTENIGRLAGKTIDHAHKHISPVTEGDFVGGFIAALQAFHAETKRR